MKGVLADTSIERYKTLFVNPGQCSVLFNYLLPRIECGNVCYAVKVRGKGSLMITNGKYILKFFIVVKTLQIKK